MLHFFKLLIIFVAYWGSKDANILRITPANIVIHLNAMVSVSQSISCFEFRFRQLQKNRRTRLYTRAKIFANVTFGANTKNHIWAGIYLSNFDVR